MKPSIAQVFFAEDWPVRISFTTFPMLFAGVILHALLPTIESLTDWWNLLRLAYYLILALLLGFVGAVLFLWIVCGPLYYLRGIMNGAPFRVGDRVQILAGPHRGRVVRVYSTWQHETLRVELGKPEDENFKDIFRPDQLFRAKESE